MKKKHMFLMIVLVTMVSGVSFAVRPASTPMPIIVAAPTSTPRSGSGTASSYSTPVPTPVATPTPSPTPALSTFSCPVLQVAYSLPPGTMSANPPGANNGWTIADGYSGNGQNMSATSAWCSSASQAICAYPIGKMPIDVYVPCKSCTVNGMNFTCSK